MPLSNYALDKFVAPALSKLSECNAIDVTGLEIRGHKPYFGTMI